MDASPTRSVRRHHDNAVEGGARERSTPPVSPVGSDDLGDPEERGKPRASEPGPARDDSKEALPSNAARNPGAPGKSVAKGRRAALSFDVIVRVIGTLLVTLSIGLIAFCAIVVIWGDPFTAWYERRHQDRLEEAFARVEPSADDLAPAKVESATARTLARQSKRQIPLGSAAGRIAIPAIDVNQILVHGARDDAKDLDMGPGLYQDYPFPGGGKPIAVAGHRTTHGAPFLDVDRLERGDRIVLTMPYGRFTYRVTRTEIVGVKGWAILDIGAAARTADERRRSKASGRCESTCEHLVLTACHPKYSAAKRIAVFAQLDAVRISTA